MKNKLYIIPGWGDTPEDAPYKKLAELVKAKGYAPVPVSVDWKKPLSGQIFHADPKSSIFGFSLGAMLASMVAQFKKMNDKTARREILLTGIGVTTFLTFFFSSTLLVNILVDTDYSTYTYNYEIYGLFGLPIMLMYLGYLIVRYKAFDVKVFVYIKPIFSGLFQTLTKCI